MSIRVTNVNYTYCPVVGINNRPFGNPGREYVEACPFYLEVSVRLRIVESGSTTYDGTATWTRTSMRENISVFTEAEGNGFDTSETAALPTGTFIARNSYEVRGDGGGRFYRDAKKQCPDFVGGGQVVSYGSEIQELVLPGWYIDATGNPRENKRYLGFSSPTGGTEFTIDSNTFTDAQWRDLRGTYSVSNTVAAVTETYDITIS